MKFEKYLQERSQYKCSCGWVYSPKNEKKPFGERHADFKCPECGGLKEKFSKIKVNEEDLGKTPVGSYQCQKCGWRYDPPQEIETSDIYYNQRLQKGGVQLKDQPDTFKCPECGVGKSEFAPI